MASTGAEEAAAAVIAVDLVDLEDPAGMEGDHHVVVDFKIAATGGPILTRLEHPLASVIISGFFLSHKHTHTNKHIHTNTLLPRFDFHLDSTLVTQMHANKMNKSALPLAKDIFSGS